MSIMMIDGQELPLSAIPLCQHKKLTGPGGDNVLRSDIADLSDHRLVVSLQMLEVWLKDAGGSA